MTYMEMAPEAAALSSALSDDTAWDRLVFDRPSQIGAREWLASELADLKTQRQQKLVSLSPKDYTAFLARQAGYKRLVVRRFAQVSSSLNASGENPVPRLRARARFLDDVVAALVVAIDTYLEEKEDEEILEDALDAFTLGMQDVDLTLAESLERLPEFRTRGARVLAEARAKLDAEGGS